MPSVYQSGRLRSMGGQTQTVTSAYSVTNDDDVILVDCTSGAVTVTMPAASSLNTSAGNKNKRWIIKKIDATTNVVTIAGAIDGATNYHLVRQNETVELVSNGSALYLTSPDAGTPRLLSKTAITTYTSAVTPLFVVPTGKTLKVTDIQIECTEAQLAGTSTTGKIGTAGNSYAELLNAGTGLVQTTATASSLLQLNDRFSVNDRFPPTNNQGANTRSFAAGTVIGYSAAKSGTVTKGTLSVELYGYLL